MNFHHARTADMDVYLCGEFKLEERAAGFGMSVVDIYRDGRWAHRAAGHDAVSTAKQWVAEQIKNEDAA
jgi:hypothetical protein